MFACHFSLEKHSIDFSLFEKTLVFCIKFLQPNVVILPQSLLQSPQFLRYNLLKNIYIISDQLIIKIFLSYSIMSVNDKKNVILALS